MFDQESCENGPVRASRFQSADPVSLPGFSVSTSDPNDTAVIRAGVAGVFYNCGLERLRRGDLDSCIADFTEALTFDPLFDLAWNNRGVARERKGDLPGATRDYEAALSVNPRLAHAWNNLGILLCRAGDLDGAIGHFSEAIGLDPTYVEARYNRGLALLRHGEFIRAARDFEGALKMDPGHEGSRAELRALRAEAAPGDSEPLSESTRK